MAINPNDRTITIIENGEEIEINYKDCQKLCDQFLAKKIARYEETHNEKVETKSKEWQIEFGKRVIDAFFNKLKKKIKKFNVFEVIHELLFS